MDDTICFNVVTCDGATGESTGHDSATGDSGNGVGGDIGDNVCLLMLLVVILLVIVRFLVVLGLEMVIV